MSTDAADADQERRWAQAEALLGDAPDPATLERVRRRRTRAWVLFAGGWVVLTAAGALAGYLYAGTQPDRPPVDDSSPLWADVLGFGLIVLGLAVGIAGIVQLRRAGQLSNRWRAPTSALNRAQQRGLRRQVTGQAPVDPAHLPVARDLAVRIMQLTRLMTLYVAMLLVLAGGAVMSPGPVRFAFVGLMALLYGAAGLLFRRDARRARRFLAAHPLDAPSRAQG